MSDLHDMELADTLERLHRKAASPPAAAPQADRTTERWQRIRAALCPFHGLTVSLDEYADLVWSAIQNTKGRTGTSLDGISAGAAEEVPA